MLNIVRYSLASAAIAPRVVGHQLSINVILSTTRTSHRYASIEKVHTSLQQRKILDYKYQQQAFIIQPASIHHPSFSKIRRLDMQQWRSTRTSFTNMQRVPPMKYTVFPPSSTTTMNTISHIPYPLLTLLSSSHYLLILSLSLSP